MYFIFFNIYTNLYKYICIYSYLVISLSLLHELYKYTEHHVHPNELITKV